MGTIDPEQIVTIRYTNYRGETSVRRIIPIEIRFVSTEWHPAPQWVLEAHDVDKVRSGPSRSRTLFSGTSPRTRTGP